MSKFKLTHLLILILGVALFAVGNDLKNTSYQLERANQDLTETNKAFEINKESISTLKKQNNELRKQINDFKEVETVTIVQTNTVIDTVTFYVSNDSIPTSCNYVQNLSIDTTYYSFDFTYSHKDFTINRLSIPNKLSIVVGDKKVKGWTGITKGTEYSIDVVNSNPYVSTLNFQTYKVVKEKKWYQTPWFYMGVGFAGAVILL